MKTILLWAITIGLILLGQVVGGGHIGSVMQNSAGIIVLMPVIAYLFYAYGFMGFLRFSKRLIMSELVEEDSPIIDTSATLGFLFSGVGCVMGLIHTMENLADTSHLGSGIAMAFVSVVYGALPAILLLPIRNHSHGKSVEPSRMMNKAAGFTAASFMMLLFSFFVVLYATSQHDLTMLK